MILSDCIDRKYRKPDIEYDNLCELSSKLKVLGFKGFIKGENAMKITVSVPRGCDEYNRKLLKNIGGMME